MSNPLTDDHTNRIAALELPKTCEMIEQRAQGNKWYLHVVPLAQHGDAAVVLNPSPRG